MLWVPRRHRLPRHELSDMNLSACGGGAAVLPPLLFLLLIALLPRLPPPPAHASLYLNPASSLTIGTHRNRSTSSSGGGSGSGNGRSSSSGDGGSNTNNPRNSGAQKVLTLGAILPGSSFMSRARQFMKRLNTSLDDLRRKKYPAFQFLSFYSIAHPEVVLMDNNPTPADILEALCEKFLRRNVTAILYVTNSEAYGANTISAQYFLQLAAYLGTPVISWNADNSGFETKLYKSVVLQLAPSIQHQSLAMLSIMQRYAWKQFSIVTSQIAGHNNFIEAVKGNLNVKRRDFSFSLLRIIRLNTADPKEMLRQLEELRNTDTRIILFYATRDEAIDIMNAATPLGLTGKDYVWIATQSIIGHMTNNEWVAPSNFPPGMLGVHFDTGDNGTLEGIENAVKVFAHGLELFINDPRTMNVSLQPNLSCGGERESRWTEGDILYGYLRNVSISLGGTKLNLEFNDDGTMSFFELEVFNLNENRKWVKIGSWMGDSLDIKDIVWPGNAHMPPPGVPEKFHLKMTFLEEPPFIHLTPPDPVSKICINRGVECRVVTDSEWNGGTNGSSSVHNGTQCCSGFCIDLLQKFASDLNFTYDLTRVEDGVWGTTVNGKWNGLIAALLHHRTDAVITALNINSYRESVVDFSVPFMETGIAVIVAKRTGIVSPKAFLEPFDTISWLLILLVSIQVATMAIFLFEWFSPFGYNMKVQAPRDHKFSLFRTYWLVWAILFGASVNVDCPRSYTARCMSNVWAMFAVVFLAIYTANLAAFMITREEYYDLSGVDDTLLLNPYSIKPPFKYGTIPFGNTEVILQKNFPAMYSYMRKYNRPTVKDGIIAIKKGEMDAFIYDATVLDYLVGQDEDCKLLTVGSWYAMTGYGIAFPRNSKHLEPFNRQIMLYKENGELERLQRFWLTGVCKPNKQERSSSKPLSFSQFMSAFLLLGCGILFALLLLLFEHLYFKYMRKYLAKKDTRGCCGLISLSMGKSLSFQQAVYEAQDLLRNHRCRDPLCDTHLWKVRHELDMARLQIRVMERMLHERDYHPSFPRSTYYNMGCADYVLRARDLTKMYVSSTERRSPVGVGHLSPRRREITEIETVL